MRTIAISNYKGGVGKTTTAVNLAAIFAARGLRTLLVDLDPQAPATDFFGLYDRAVSERRTSVELLYGGAPVEEVAYAAGENLDVVASTIDLVDQNEMLLREQRLKFALDDASGSYDVCLIDCSPVMRRLAFNAYLAAAEGGMVVIPQDREIYDFCPVQHPADDPGSDIITTHFDYHKMEDNLLKLDMLGHDDPTMIRMMEDLTGVNAREIPLDDQDTMTIFTNSAPLGFENDPVLGPTGAVAVPEFNTKFTRQMLCDTQPKRFNTLVRLSGFSHGTDVWLGNARDLIVSGTATVDSTVGCRDDIMLYLMEQGVEPKMAFDIMEAVRKGKVKKGGFQDGWEDAMHKANVPDWYIESLAKIGYLFPKAHAVAYVMMAFRIAWFKVHRPLAFYAAYFSIRAKALDANCMCRGMDVCQRKMKEIESKEKPADVEEKMLITLEVCYEFYLRGFSFEPIDLYESDATKFLMNEEKKSLRPPFSTIPGLGEAAALSLAENRTGRTFISQEELIAACPGLSKSTVEMLRQAGALGTLPETSQISLF